MKHMIMACGIFSLMCSGGCFCVYESKPIPRAETGFSKTHPRIQLEGFVTAKFNPDSAAMVETIDDASGAPVSRAVVLTSGDVEIQNLTVALFEDAGFKVRGNTKPQYTVFCQLDQARLDTDYRGFAMPAASYFSLFFAYGTYYKQDAHLRIYDSASGELIHKETIVEKYELVLFSPFWIFGNVCNPRLHPDRMTETVSKRAIPHIVDAAAAFIGAYKPKK